MGVGRLKRHLITTSDERSWKSDGPVLFLGEWCRRYDRKSVWSAMDAIVAEPYGLDAEQRARDLVYVKAVAAELLEDLVSALNMFHGTAHGRRYWQIILGHWVLRYVSVVFNRYATLEQALRRYEISGTTVVATADDSLATTDSDSFVWACDDDVWNHVFYSRILAHWNLAGLENVRPVDGVTGFAQTRARDASKGRRLGDIARKAASRLLRTLSRPQDALIVRTYLPLNKRIGLELSLGQCPQLWRTPQMRTVAPDSAERELFVVDASKREGFEQYLRLTLPHVIPSCYLEGYPTLLEQAEALPWPSRPKFIFTSNSFDTDELFKAWTAAHVEKGVPYVVGQHGNNYGTHVWWGSDVWPERAASDRFITWGWTDESPQTSPGFIFKTAGRKARETASVGGLLLIEVCVPHLIEPHDCYAQFDLYQEEQFRFVNALPDAIRHQLTVRLYAEYRRHRWCEEDRWRDRAPQAHLEPGTAPIKSLIDKSRLVVHSYDSTGILETLALNIPTMCFWHGGLGHLLAGARPYYEHLRAAGILLDTPEKAAEMVAMRWSGVEHWWGSDTVQHARRAFCDRFARSVSRPVRTARAILDGASAHHGLLASHRASA